MIIVSGGLDTLEVVFFRGLEDLLVVMGSQWQARARSRSGYSESTCTTVQRW